MTHLFRGNVAGEILDADGKVVGRILAPTTQEQRSWPGDFEHENGQYHCVCGVCRRGFVGHKRRFNCRACATFTDWSQHAVRVPERQIPIGATQGFRDTYFVRGWNAALDAIMGVAK